MGLYGKGNAISDGIDRKKSNFLCEKKEGI